jgi:hypothetical protein
MIQQRKWLIAKKINGNNASFYFYQQKEMLFLEPISAK